MSRLTSGPRRMKLSMQSVLGWVFKARYLAYFKLWTPVTLPLSYSLSRYRVESVPWQEDGRVALVENVYSAVHGLRGTTYSAMDGPGEPFFGGTTYSMCFTLHEN